MMLHRNYGTLSFKVVLMATAPATKRFLLPCHHLARPAVNTCPLGYNRFSLSS